MHIQSELMNKSFLFEMCKYGYYNLCDSVLKDKNLDVNKINEMFESFIEMENIDKITDAEMFTSPHGMPVVKQKLRLCTLLYIVIRKCNFEIAKLPLNHEKINVNIINKCLTIESLATS